MRITTKGRYALSAVVALACLASEDDPVSIRALSRNEGLSADFLEQIFFRLRRSGIVNSVRGPGGGFRLARPSRDISLHEILSAAGEDLLGPAPGSRPAAKTAGGRRAKAETRRAEERPEGIGMRKASLVFSELESELKRFAVGKSLADIVGAKRV